jgi:hypothetical protein
MATDLSQFEPVNPPTDLSQFEAYKPRGALSEIGTGLKSGLYEGAAGAGAAMQAPAEKAGQQPGFVSRVGKSLEEWGTHGAAAPENQPQPGQHNVVTNTLAEAAKGLGSAVPMLGAQAAGAAAGQAAVPIPVVGAVLGGGAAAGGYVAAQTWHQEYQKALKSGLSDEAARTHADDSAMLQGGLMAGAGAAGGAIGAGGSLVSKAAGLGAKDAVEAGAAVTGKKFLPEFAKGAGEMTAVNTGLGVGGAAGQAAIDQSDQMKTLSPWEAAKEALLPSLGGSIGFLPLVALGAHTNVKTAQDIQAKLADAGAHPQARVRAATQVAEAMKKADPTGARMWQINAAEAIKNGQPIGMDSSWTQGPHPDVFPEAQPPAEPPKALPAPGDVALQTSENSGPFEQSTAPEDNAAAIQAARDAEEARLAAFASQGPLSAATAEGIRSGAVADKTAERKLELAPEGQESKPELAQEPSPELTAWTQNQAGRPLQEAQNIAAMAERAGKDYTVIPHPAGDGYAVVPDQLVSPKLQEQYAGLQRGGQLPAPEHQVPGRMVSGEEGTRPQTFGNLPPADDIARAKRMPFATPEAARMRADALTQRTGTEWEVVPHEFAHDKYGVQPKTDFTEREQQQGVNNAETVRSDQGQPRPEDAVAGGENRGREDLQQPAQAWAGAGHEQAGREGVAPGIQQGIVRGAEATAGAEHGSEAGQRTDQAARAGAGEQPESGRNAGTGSGAGAAGVPASPRAVEAAREAPPLVGLPKSSPGPFAPARAAAAAYMADAGLPHNPPKDFARVDPARSKRIAAAYEAMEHAPNDPKVKAAYKAMIDETMAQWQAIKKTGLKVDFADAEHPYPYKIPHEVFDDIHNNNHMWVFPTEGGFGGSESAHVDITGNPLLADTGEVINGHKAVANDIFRIVHDYFGHAKEGVGFRADGEENAWRAHASMYSEKARAAMTSETRGQNSWVNFGPHGEKNKSATQEDTQYAPQKTGLLPDEFVRDNYAEKKDDGVFSLSDDVPGLKAAQRGLLPEERAKLRTDTAKKFVDIIRKLPSANEMAAVAKAGEAKRGWYRESALALNHVFGDDAPRFAALLASMSPQTGVEANLRNALKTWKNWIAAGRPTERGKIFKIMGESVEGNKLTDSVLPAWINNSVRSLQHPDPAKLTISGPKVNSFLRNLIGHTDEVTNDSWMAAYGGVDQKIFAGRLNAAGTEPGKTPGYLAMSARVREAAKVLTKYTGDKWTPAEVQETIWSWAKSLYELANNRRSAREILKDKALTDELINATPDFRTLLHEERNEATLRAGGYGDRLDSIHGRGADETAGRRESGSGVGGKASPITGEAGERLLNKAAGRLDELREKRADKGDAFEEHIDEGRPDDIAFKQGEKTTGLSAKDVQDAITPLLRTMRNAPKVRVVQSISNVAGTKMPANARGIYKDGFVHLVADNIKDAKTAQFVYLHEVAGHHGLRGLFGDSLNPILDKIYDTNDRVRQLAAEQMSKYGYDRTLATEEALADLAGSGEAHKLAGWKMLVAAVRNALRKIGVDIEFSDEDVRALLAASRKFAERGEVTGGAGDLKAAFSQKAPVFYSALERAIAGHKQGAAPADHWRAIIDGLPGIKKDEVEWSGVKDYLKAEGGKVTREQLLDFVRNNGVKVEEHTLGAHDSRLSAEEVQSMWDSINADKTWVWQGYSMIPHDGAIILKSAHGPDEAFKSPKSALRAINQDLERRGATTKFESYQLPGGSNYRELLLTLPSAVKGDHLARLDERIQELEDDREAGERQATIEAEIKAAQAARNKAAAGVFRSSHFDQPNVLAHVRFNERTDADGKKVLFIEELQSDWAQKGRKEGFAKDTSGWTAKLLSAPDAGFNKWQISDASGNRVTDIVGGTKESAIRKAAEGIPHAPFVGKTEAWTALALKRMIRYAADNGFDRVAWTNGEQQAERYDLSKHFRTIQWNDRSGALKGITIDGKDHSFGKVQDGAGLDEYVGKEVANKLRSEASNNRGYRTLTGLGLKVGGEGMKGFYDRIVPSVANDVLKKLGGGRVGEVDLGALSEKPVFNKDTGKDVFQNQLQPGFDITPQMKAMAEGGLPLFSMEDGTQARAGQLANKRTGGKAGESEAQFSKGGKVLREKGAGPQPINPNDLPKWMRGMRPATIEAMRKAGGWVETKPLRQRLQEGKHEAGLRILQATTDQFASILPKLGDMPYKLARMASAYDAGVETLLHFGQIELNSAGAIARKADTKGVLETLKPLKGEADRFMMWMAGQRAERLSAEDREHNFGAVDIAELKGLNGKMHAGDNMADGTDGAQRKMIYGQVAKEFMAIQKSMLDLAEKSGTLDSELRKVYENQFYVPFYREAEDGSKAVRSGNVSGLVNQYFSKRLKGGDGVLHDLLANTIQNWSHLVQSSLKNNAATKILDEAVKRGFADRAKSSDDGVVYVLKNGKQEFYKVDDHLLLDSISALEASPFKVPQSLAWFKHMLTVGTTLSPIFRVRHTIREQVASLILGHGSYNPVKNWIDGFKYSSRNNPEYGNMLAGGSFFRMGYGYEANRGAYFKQLLAHDIDHATVLDTPGKVKNALEGAWDWWKETGERSDSITRANRYRNTYAEMIAAGKNPDQAHFEASYAARSTLDYGLHGTSAAVKMITGVVPFMNARLQGLYVIGKAAHADPQRFATVIGGVTLATMALSLAYRDDKEMQQREEWDRDNNWAFRIGDKMFRVPKPFELGAIATVADRALEAALDGFAPSDRERFIERILPIIGSQLNLNPIASPLIATPIQLWGNKDWFTGRSIESQRELKMTTAERIGPHTSQLGIIGGKAGLLSPEQIDFAVNSFFGWVGAHALMTADLALRPMMGAPNRPAARIDEVPVLGDFMKTLPQNQSRDTEAFYKHLTDVQQAFGDMRMLQQTGQMEQAVEVMKEKKNDIALHGMYLRTQRELGKLSQRERWVNMRNLDPDEKRAELDRLAQAKNRLTAVAESTRAQAINMQ